MSNVYKTIIYEKKGNIAWITLNRPEVLNAQNDQMREEFVNALEIIGKDDEVHAVIITGSGDKAFSAGADISEFPVRYPNDWVRDTWVQRHYDIIRNLPKPVIAAVNGFALGGGCEIILACDCVIAADNAQFGQPEIKVGVIPGGGGTQILPRIIGEKRAKELIFGGRNITAAEALAVGLVNQVVPRDKLIEAATKMAGEFIKNSPAILRLAKIAVNKSLETTVSVGLQCERELFALCFGTEDQKEGARAFLEKRKPSYKGK